MDFGTRHLKARTSLAFFPHGLSHHLGLKTHDVGGNARFGEKDTYYRYLRIRGALQVGNVVTVESGVSRIAVFYLTPLSNQIYFSTHIIEGYLEDERHKRFIDVDVLETYWAVGGIRCVLIVAQMM